MEKEEHQNDGKEQGQVEYSDQGKLEEKSKNVEDVPSENQNENEQNNIEQEKMQIPEQSINNLKMAAAVVKEMTNYLEKVNNKMERYIV